jgi:siderophore synthetase component
VRFSEVDAWHAAGALITYKMLGELSYEHMLEPLADGDGYRLELPDDVVYTFRARRGAFDGWTVAPHSAYRSGEPVTDPRALVVDARKVLGLSGLRLADVLAELTSTVANEATRLRRAPSAADLSTMDYNVADGHLTGHPRLVLNKGRVGFSALDRARYAPEAGADVRLRWFAVHPGHAEFRCVGELSRDALLDAELGDLRAEFAGRAPEDYVWVPVHPWQADKILGTLYAAELATGVMIDLGEGADGYRAHQTVRTLANVSTPGRHDVKTAVSVRNTLVYRGLDSAATLAGPSLTSWLRRVSAGDPLLAEKYRFGLLGEVASVSVKHPLFGHLEELPYRFHETLGALWREPLTAHLEEGERAISFAALPYRGPDGVSVLAHLIGDGDPETWLTRLFDLTLTPLLQWLLRHGVGFCPHGQNLILVVDTAGVPQRVLIKDFAQGVDLLDEPLESYGSLPPEAAADMLRWPAHLLAQSLFSSVFSGQFRFWAEVLLDELGLPRAKFWAPVREIVGRYRDENPDVATRFDACRLFAPDVERVTLNREHFAGQGFDKVERDDEFDVRWGRVPNPLHAADPGGAW